MCISRYSPQPGLDWVPDKDIPKFDSYQKWKNSPTFYSFPLIKHCTCKITLSLKSQVFSLINLC